MLGVAALGCAIIWAIPGGAADPKDKGLEDADVKALVEANDKIIQDALSQTKVTKALKLKARTAALMIAAAAQSGGAARNAQLATQRDAAIKIAEALDQDKVADALDVAKLLATLKPDPNVKLDAVPLIDKSINLDDVMNQFAGERGGGLVIESKLEKWEDEAPKELAEVNEAALQMQLIFEVARDHKLTTKQAGLGTPEKWQKFVDAARGRTTELRAAAGKGDKDGVQKAAKAVNMACMDCHKVFRPRN
jgi:cytochrome c556